MMSRDDSSRHYARLLGNLVGEAWTGKAVLRPGQRDWAQFVISMGGRSGVICSVDDALRLVAA